MELSKRRNKMGFVEFVSLDLMFKSCSFELNTSIFFFLLNFRVNAKESSCFFSWYYLEPFCSRHREWYGKNVAFNYENTRSTLFTPILQFNIFTIYDVQKRDDLRKDVKFFLHWGMFVLYLEVYWLLFRV